MICSYISLEDYFFIFTNKLLSGLCKQMSQETYAGAAVSLAVWFVNSHTISMKGLCLQGGG